MVSCDAVNEFNDVKSACASQLAVDTACGTPSESPTHAYPCVMFGKSLLLPLPITIISPSVASTLPHIPMFCIKSEPVGLVEVNTPAPFTYTDAPATNPSVDVSNPFTLPLIITTPLALFDIASLVIPIAGISPLTEESANFISTFSPVTPVA